MLMSLLQRVKFRHCVHLNSKQKNGSWQSLLSLTCGVPIKKRSGAWWLDKS